MGSDSSSSTTLKPANGNAQHLLVIRLSAMGDVAMTVPVLIALTQKYPHLKITVLTKPFFEPILAQIPNVTVHKAEVKGRHRGVLGLWKLYKELKHTGIDSVADLHNVLRSSILKRFFKFQGIPFVQVDKARKEKKALTAVENKIFKPMKMMHLRYADVFASLGFPVALENRHILSTLEITLRLKQVFGLKVKRNIGVAPFAAFSGKMYPVHLMKEVLEQLNSLGAYQILLFGGGSTEKKQLEVWEQELEHCVSVVGKINFEEELALISNLDLMVAMDSGNSHLAAMYGIPTITLWGVTHPFAGFYPFGQAQANALLSDREKYPLIPTSVYGNKFPGGYDRAMETIAPEQVIQKIKEVLRLKETKP
ncbi:MAG: ADP-heptose:LPS heptosyltransferase [Maribacter sp.]|jgi:ADP-heptose:LPS heptosyltransferase